MYNRGAAGVIPAEDEMILLIIYNKGVYISAPLPISRKYRVYPLLLEH